MPNKQQERRKRFDEKFYEGDRNSIHCRKHKTYATPFEVLSFLNEEVSLAVANREKEIVELLEKNANEINYNDWEVGDIINLISKNK